MAGSSILITGGAGYLGSALVPELLNAGHQVTVLDTFMFNQFPFGHICHLPNFELVRGDARDETLVAELVRRHDLMVPLAGLVGAPLCDRDPAAATAINLDAVRMMLRLASPEQRVLYPNTV